MRMLDYEDARVSTSKNDTVCYLVNQSPDTLTSRHNVDTMDATRQQIKRVKTYP